MELKEMSVAELQERKSQIISETHLEDADLDALESEMDSINNELKVRAAEESKKAELRKKVATMDLPVVDEVPKTEERGSKMDLKELRNSKEYVDAYASYIKTGKDEECRSLLTTNVEGGVLPVPEIVTSTIQTAWERSDIMGRVRSTTLRGNVKIGFELSATDATVHVEGAAAPAEEEITLGIVTMIPQTIKKWISISDEALAMGGAEFLAYIYDEITYRIAKACENAIVEIIARLPQTATAVSVSAAEVEAEPALGTVATALANLSSAAANPIVVMNRLTWAAFKAAEYAGNFPVDPFEGLEVVFTEGLPSYDAAQGGEVYAIVGDFYGAQANYPEGEAIRIRMNDLSRAKEDIVEFVGRRYVGLGVTKDKYFALIAKPE